jgi:hypothetical protein
VGSKPACSHGKDKSSLTWHCTTVHACEKTQQTAVYWPNRALYIDVFTVVTCALQTGSCSDKMHNFFELVQLNMGQYSVAKLLWIHLKSR